MSFDLEHIDPEVVKNIKILQDKLALFDVHFDLLGLVAKLPEYKKQVIAEIVAELRPQLSSEPLPADVDAVVAKLRPELVSLVDKAEASIANKVAEIKDVLLSRVNDLSAKVSSSGGTVDVEALAKSQAMVGVMVDIANKVCQEMARQIQAGIYEEMEKRKTAIYEQEKQRLAEGGAAADTGANAPQGSGVKSLVDAIVTFASTPVGGKVLDRIFPPPAALLGDPKEKLKSAYELVKILRGLNLDEAGSDKLITTLTTGQPPATPTPPAKA